MKKKLGNSGLTLHGTLEIPGHIEGLPRGTHALSLSVVNDRKPIEDKSKRDEGYVFQVGLSLCLLVQALARLRAPDTMT
ncbi:MAG: hypothetical protein GY811_10555 [Myxococcales bacterium]|nr:hypothetical protein [Myxococcales bacterium]